MKKYNTEALCICPKCGGMNVLMASWSAPNDNNKFVDYIDANSEKEGYCIDCDRNIYVEGFMNDLSNIVSGSEVIIYIGMGMTERYTVASIPEKLSRNSVIDCIDQKTGVTYMIPAKQLLSKVF